MGPVHIGRYRIIEELGRGGMGVVYRGEDPVLERQVAVKILPPKKLTQKAIDRFMREAKTAARLDSPHIVKIHDIGEVDDIHFIVMEFVEGKTLGDLLADGLTPDQPKLEERLRIFWQVLQAVRYAHDNGVIHRDLKPDNIMVTPSGQVKVMDFGLAFFEGSHSLTEVGQVMGTAAYVSPEQAVGKVTDARTDIYSLGVILFEMMTGRWPFEATHPLEMFRKVAEAPPPSPRDFNTLVPLSLEMIILRALRKNPDDRYGKVSEFMAEMEHFLKRSSFQVERADTSRPPSYEAPPAKEAAPPLTMEPGKWKAPAPAKPPVFPSPGPALRAPIDATKADTAPPRPPEAATLAEKPRAFSPAAPPLVNPPPSLESHDPVAEALGLPTSSLPPTPPPSQAPAFQPYVQGLSGGIASTSWMQNVKQEQVTGRIDRLMDRLRDDEQSQNRLLEEDPRAAKTLCARCGSENPVERKLCADCGEVLSPSHFLVDREARTHMEGGLTLYRNGQYKEAIFEFLQALSRDEDLGEAHLYLGRSYLETGEHGRARESLEKAVDLLAESPDPYLALADFYQRTDQPEQVIATLHHALDRDPADANTRCRLAFLYHERNRVDAAVDQYRLAIGSDPEHLEANRQLGLILAAADRVDEAIPYLEQACRLDPQDPHTHSLLARFYARRRRYGQAQQVLRTAIQLDVRDASLRAEMAALYQAQGQDNLAAQELKEALDLDRGNRDASVRLAQLLDRHGRPQEAVRRLDEALQYHPQDLQIHRHLGELHLRNGELDQALKHFEEVVKLDPASAELHQRLGRIYLKKRYDQKSVDAYRKAVEAEKSNPEYREDLGMAYYCAGQLPLAVQELSKASLLDYSNPEYPKALGMLHAEMGDFEESVRQLKRSLELSPVDAQAHGMLGRALARQGLTNLAIAEYERALDLDGDLYLLHLYLARAFAQAGRHDRAVDSFRKFLARVGNQEDARMLGEAYVDMGRSYLAARDYTRAAEVFQAALQRNGRDSRALHGLARVAMARRDFAKAQDWLDRAMTAEPRNTDFKLTLARLRADQERWGDAVQVLREAVQEEPSKPELHEELGRALRKAGRTEDAAEVFRRAAQAFPDKAGHFSWLYGRLLFRQSEFVEAAFYYRKALDLEPHDWRIYVDLGKACASMFQMDQAAEAFQHALEWAPADEKPKLKKVAARLAAALE